MTPSTSSLTACRIEGPILMAIPFADAKLVAVRPATTSSTTIPRESTAPFAAHIASDP